jgi:uncharacterized damage-inducible protein DinB
MDGPTLAYQLEWTQRTIGVNIEGITHDDSLSRPDAGGNCINWVLGHIVASRNGMLATLGQPPYWSDDSVALYRRGSSGELPTDGLKSLPTLITDLDASSARVRAALETVDESALAAPAPSGDRTVGQRLAFLVFHESYHVGQIGLLRRLVGQPGAIR